MRRRWIGVGAVGLLLAAGTAARADAIDGDWCAPDGKAMSIEGPRIVTPGGTALTGDYSRHAFAYVVPAGEPSGGSEVRLVLLDEDTMRMTSGPGPEIWRRCDVTS